MALWRRSLADAAPRANNSLVLAAARTHRSDPFANLTAYSGGWNISDEHYWAVRHITSHHIHSSHLLPLSLTTPRASSACSPWRTPRCPSSSSPCCGSSASASCCSSSPAAAASAGAKATPTRRGATSAPWCFSSSSPWPQCDCSFLQPRMFPLNVAMNE